MSSPGKGEKTSEMETETNDSSLEVTSDTGEAALCCTGVQQVIPVYLGLTSKHLKGNAVLMTIISMLKATHIKHYKLIDLSIKFYLTQLYFDFKELNAVRTS